MKPQYILLVAALLAIVGCSETATYTTSGMVADDFGLGHHATSQPGTQPAPDPEALADFKKVAETLGRTGELRGEVYTITVPRDDLSVSVDSMAIPTAAGIESTFKFYRCHCGRTVVIGQMVVADYEANDVLFSLQKQDFLVSSLGPFLLYEKPALMCLRFQAEGTAPAMAEGVKQALAWTAKHRGAQ